MNRGSAKARSCVLLAGGPRRRGRGRGDRRARRRGRRAGTSPSGFGTGVGARGPTRSCSCPKRRWSRPGSPRTTWSAGDPRRRAGGRTSCATCLELRLFTEITDGIDAARVAEEIERELVELLGGATVSIEAERHWSEPFNYELGVTIVTARRPGRSAPFGSPTPEGAAGSPAGTTAGAASSGGAPRATSDVVLIVPEVHGAEVAFLPWSSPRGGRVRAPLVAVDVPRRSRSPTTTTGIRGARGLMPVGLTSGGRSGPSRVGVPATTAARRLDPEPGDEEA